MGSEDGINKLHTELAIHLDSNKKFIAVFQNLSKAFDLVKHEKVITKIEEAGCGGDQVLKWFQTYLENREQR